MASLPAGTRLGPYELGAIVGSGGMGEVYRARDTRLGRDVAVKVLPGSVANDPDRIRRFEQEARAAGALNHPNILTVLDVGSEDGLRVVVSELLEGAALDAELSSRTLSMRDVIGYGVQVARGLAAVLQPNRYGSVNRQRRILFVSWSTSMRRLPRS